jgi:tetratricopeptide (TPR) repeat protein
VDEALAMRVAELAPDVRRVAELVCVAGGPVGLSALAQAAVLDEPALETVATQLRLANLARPALSHGQQALEPFHDRVREAIRARLPQDALARRHHRLALALEAQADADLQALAAHWQGAGDAAKAFRYTTRAAEEAAAAFAFGRAARLWQRAVELAHEPDDRRRAWVALGAALASAGRGVESARAYLQAVPGAPRLDALELERRAANELFHAGQYNDAIGVAKRVLRAVGLCYPRTPRSALVRTLVRRARLWARGLDRAHAAARKASEVPALDRLRIDVAQTVSHGLGYSDNVRGAYFQTMQLALAMRAGEPGRLASAIATEAPFLAAVGPRTRRRTARLVCLAETLARRSDDPNAHGRAAFSAGFSAMQQGRFASARKFLEYSERIIREQCPGARWELVVAQVSGIWCRAYLGELDTFAELVPLRLREADERGDFFAQAYLRTGMPNLSWLLRDEVDLASAEIDSTLAGLPSQAFYAQHCFALLARTHVDLYAGRAAAAHERMVATWPTLRQSMFLYNQMVRITMTHLRGSSAAGAAALLDGEARESVLRVAKTAIRRLTRERVAWAEALAELLRAQVAIVRGERERAIGLLDGAALALEDADMVLQAQAARFRRAELTDGPAGKAAADRAAGFFLERRVKRPERVCAMVITPWGSCPSRTDP